VQATVRSYDGGTRSGSVFTDDGTVLAFGADALADSGLRLLRPGQRVQFRTDGDPPRITALTLATFPLPAEGLSRVIMGLVLLERHQSHDHDWKGVTAS
jgi:cold shock CspA family protein